MNSMYLIIQIIIGFSSGIAVGLGFIALLTMLKVIPRLIHLSKNIKNSWTFIYPVIIGTLFGSYLSFTDYSIHLPLIFIIVFGLLHGIFNGMLAAALAEVLNVLPIISRRIKLHGQIRKLMMALVFGKTFGSLFQWIIFVKI